MRIKVDKKSNTITIDQQQHIELLLLRFKMFKWSIDTPIECKLNLEKAENCVYMYLIKDL